jgi:hypothetical protein
MANWGTNKGRFDIVNRWLLGSTAPQGVADLRAIAVDTPPASAGAAADLDFASAITADELVGTGYSRFIFAGETALENDTTDLAAVDVTDPAPQTLGADNGTIAGWYIVRWVTSDADSPIIVFLDTADLVTNGGNVQFAAAAAGLFTLGG